MKDQYFRLAEIAQKRAIELELEAEQEMKTGSGAKAMDLCRRADMKKIDARNYKMQAECL